ncbi:MAG: ligase-associated DNA damage response endonuclease PdeM [Wenzhouxiangella sp.]|nr:ligase-associated DNA damage response endonuclease PdeM [Wenzhouxiangella sp.]
MSARIDLGGHRLELRPERALFWPEQRTLLVADVHLGKDQVFRRQGLAVPAGVVGEELRRLDQLLDTTRAERLIVLGDWVHAPPRSGDRWPLEVLEWRRRHRGLSVELVQGNHDRLLGHWLREWHMVDHAERLVIGGLSLVHEWLADQHSAGVSGHLHPGVQIRSGHERVRLPAFLRGDDHLVLPAFGRFTGLMERTVFPATQRWVIAGDSVLSLPPKIRA